MGGVSVGVVSRSAEFRAIAEFLGSTDVRPTGLLMHGDPGIGKTTLWLVALEQARARGFRVLSARAWEAESVMAYGTVADLVRDVPADVLAGLPDVQRVALDRVLLRDVAGGPATDQHVVAAAVLAVIETLACDTPVVVGIDDVQWLDSSSQAVVAFVARRLRGRAGLLATERSEPERDRVLSWLQLGTPDGIRRVRIGPMSLGGLHELFSARLGRSFPRPTMVQIAEVSGGNPFYALELAHAIGSQSPSVQRELPRTLSDLVRMRVGDLNHDARDPLLAAACVADPTVEIVARATGASVERTTQLLEEAESKGILGIVGNRVRYSHPLLAHGVYIDASPARRRQVHRALSEVEVLPELKARHLALAASKTDPDLLKALDDAADAARARGAPAAAAELADLAISLGGGAPYRRMRAADHHLRAGDTEKAQAVLEPAMDELPKGTLRALALNLLAGIRIYDNTFTRAVDLLKSAVDDAQGNTAVLAHTLLMLSFAQANAGEYDESLRDARRAVTLAEGIGHPTLISQALANCVTVEALCGHGVDEPSLVRALELEDRDGDIPIPFRATATAAQVLGWCGRLDEANTHIISLHRRCTERGTDSDMMFVVVHHTLIDIWRGSFTEAAQVAEDAMERAQQLGGDHPLAIAGSVRALVAAYTGREADARAYATAALESARRCGSPGIEHWPHMIVGFLEVSLGNHAAALSALQSPLSRFGAVPPGTELLTAWYVADAAEAMVALGRVDEAEPVIEAVERNGRILDRSWMLAIGARCRGMILAAQGDLEAAERSARQAINEHDRLPMPFERARTQLLLGQLQRRQRRKHAAAETLGEAVKVFEELGSPLWAARARAELARTNVAPSRDLELTPSQRRVAELAASGMTNRDVAAKLFVSAKTVEANLTQVYRKLGIHSRAELGRLMGDANL